MRIKNRLIEHADIYLINIIGLVVGIAFYFLLKEKIEIIGACLATTISISVGLRSYKIEDDKMFKELFESFNRKYDLKYNDELNRIDNETIIQNDNLIIDYLNFCSEEYLWYTKGRIPSNVWAAWRKGILFHLNKKPIRKILERELGQKDSYYGLFENLEI